MQADQTSEDVVDAIKRFRILCVGRPGVGKSSVVNRVFRLETEPTPDPGPGDAGVEKERISTENLSFVLHYSHGFEPGDTKTFDTVNKFIKKRCDAKLPLKDRLHAVWLCTETPRSGGRIFETGDEELLRLAHQTQTPIVVVFTKYDRLLRTKRAELRDDDNSLTSEVLEKRSKEEGQKVFATCVQSLERTVSRLKIQMPLYVKVSIYPGYEADFSSLVEATDDLVRGKFKGNDVSLMWAIAQRASPRVKLDACVGEVVIYFRRALAGSKPNGEMSLRDFLAKVHRDIITCWNFRDEKNILDSGDFKKLMLCLVQDVQESQNYVESDERLPPAIDKISRFLTSITAAPPPIQPPPVVINLTDSFENWLSNTALHSGPQIQIQRAFMTYTVYLTKMLKSLFDYTLMPQSSGRATWLGLKKAFETPEVSGSCKTIHRRICGAFQQDRQILDPNGFDRMFLELVGVGSPLLVRIRTKSRNAQNARAQTEPSSPPPTPTGRRSWLSLKGLLPS